MEGAVAQDDLTLQNGIKRRGFPLYHTPMWETVARGNAEVTPANAYKEKAPTDKDIQEFEIYS